MNDKISVIMGIYNCENTLMEALECIAKQTYTNWEIVMCEDGSSDHTWDVAQEFVDKYPDKCILLRNERNQGLNYTLNKCLKYATGDFIARMDGDDLCDESRFMEEISVLKKYPEYAIVSSDMNFFDESGIWGKTHVKQYPVKEDLVKGTPFCHAPCMVRRKAYLDVEGYSVSKKLLRVEDYHLWVKMYANGYRGVNIQRCLYSMRDDKNAEKRRQFRFRLNEAYVKHYAIQSLKLKKSKYIYCLIPILKGILPMSIYRILHRKNMSK